MASQWPWLTAGEESALTIALILLGTWVAIGIAGILFRRYGAIVPGTPASLIASITRIVILAVGVTIALGRLGIAIAPILTALGVGGLAVALALQDTLANLFAGLQLLMSRQIKPGDYVKFDAGEGYVEDITLRNTVVRDAGGSRVVVPNSKVSQAAVTVWSSSGLRFAIPFSVPRKVALDALQREAVEAARAAGAREASFQFVSTTHDAIGCLVAVQLDFGTDPFEVRSAVLERVAGASREV